MPEPQELDLRDLKCPLPVLRTRKALRGMRPGERLMVLCTDPLACIDIPNLLREEGDGLEHQARVDGVARFLIVRGAGRADRLAVSSFCGGPAQSAFGSETHDVVTGKPEDRALTQEVLPQSVASTPHLP